MSQIHPQRVLFNASPNRSRLQRFACRGYDEPVLGTIYPRASLRWHGVPLGGLGTSYVCWDPDGRLSQCTLFNQVPNASQVPDIGLIPFSLVVDGRPYDLALRGADQRGDLTDLRYFGHYPVCDMQFTLECAVQVEVRAYAPFFPGDAVESNTPAVIFEVWLVNSGSNPADIALRMTAPTPPRPFTSSEISAENEWQVICGRHPWDKANPRLGGRPLEHELALAAQVGSVACTDGVLQSSLHRVLEPGQTVCARYILAWYQPHLRDSWNRAERLRYADRFSGAAGVVRYAVARYDSWLERIIAWQSVLYARKELAPELREALLNSFYALCKNSHWVTCSRADDWFPSDGMLLVNESYTTCSLSETLPCHYFGSLPVLLFFPELERTTLEAYRHYQLPSGEVPFSLDKGFGARAPNYQTQHTNGINEYIELVYRYYLRTHDESFLADFYPSVLLAARYAAFLDTDKDGLVNEHSHALPGEFWPANLPWDTWPQEGTSSYTAIKSLSALRALAAMARRVGDGVSEERFQTLITRGQARLNENLWNGAYYSLQIGTDGKRDDTCLSAQLTGVWATELLGLPDILPREYTERALNEIYRLTSGLSPYGLVLAAGTDGSAVYSNQSLACDFSRDVWPLFNFIYAATCYYQQAALDAGSAAASAVLRSLYHGANAMPWGWPCSINASDGWIGHGHDYNDPQAIWSIPLAASGLALGACAASESLIGAIIAAASGRDR